MEKQLVIGGRGRLGIGETRPKEIRKNFSNRAKLDKIEVLKKRCPFCNHNKIFKNDNYGFKCCKCKEKFKKI